MSETSLYGLTHQCDDPDCHVPGFVTTLKRSEGDHPRASVTEAIAAWEAKGPTSLTVALMAEALYGVREAAPDTQPAPASGEGEASQVVYDLLVDHPMWIGNDGRPLDYLPEREARITDFIDTLTPVLAAREARLVAERDEEREKVRRVEEVLREAEEGADTWGTCGGEWLRIDKFRAALGGEQAGDGGREGK